jgi:hypothetical protein
MTKKIGDLVFFDGYNSIAQQYSDEYPILNIDYKYDEDTGEKFPIYFVADRWFDGRNGGEYNKDNSMFYIEL